MTQFVRQGQGAAIRSDHVPCPVAVNGKITDAATAALVQLGNEIGAQLIAQVDSLRVDSEIPQNLRHVGAGLFMQPDAHQAQLNIHLAVLVCIVNLDHPVLHCRFRLITEVVT